MAKQSRERELSGEVLRLEKKVRSQGREMQGALSEIDRASREAAMWKERFQQAADELSTLRLRNTILVAQIEALKNAEPQRQP